MQITVFLFYAGYRCHGIVNNDSECDSSIQTPVVTLPQVAASDLAFDILACEALILFPRSVLK